MIGRILPRSAPILLCAAALTACAGCSPDPRVLAETSPVAVERRDSIARSERSLAQLARVGHEVSRGGSDWCDAGQATLPWERARLRCHLERRVLVDPAQPDVSSAADAMRASLREAGCAASPLTDDQLTRDVDVAEGGVFTAASCSGVTILVRWYSAPEPARTLQSEPPFEGAGFWVERSTVPEDAVAHAGSAHPFLWWLDVDHAYVDERS